MHAVQVMSEILLLNDFTRPEQLREAPGIDKWLGAERLTSSERTFLSDVGRGKRKRRVTR